MCSDGPCFGGTSHSITVKEPLVFLVWARQEVRAAEWQLDRRALAWQDHEERPVLGDLLPPSHR